MGTERILPGAVLESPTVRTGGTQSANAVEVRGPRARGPVAIRTSTGVRSAVERPCMQ